MKNWIKEERGQQVVLVALLMPLLLCAVGLVIDLGMVYARRQQAQNAADAAVLAGAAALCTNGTDGQLAATNSANDYVALNGFTGKADIKFPPVAQNFTSYIRVVITDTYTPVFVSIVWRGTFTITASTTAGCRGGGGGNPVLVLDPTRSQSMRMTGSASVTVNNGTIHVNSSDLVAVQAPASGHITTATGMEIVGSYAPFGSSNITPAPVIHSAVVEDPLKNLPAPTGTGCPFWGPNVPSDNHFKPGIYTGGLSIGGGGNVTFDTGGACAGVYIIRGDAFKVAGSVNLSGSGLFFYIDTDSSLVHSGNGYVNFSPQTSGDYVGVLFFQARDNHPAAFWGGGANANSFSGVLYFPAAGLDFGGSGEFNITFIVDQFNLNGAGNVIIDGYLGKTAGQGTWALVD